MGSAAWLRGLSALALCAMAAGGVVAVEKNCLATYRCDRGGNPWSGMTATAAEEQANMSVRAVAANEPGYAPVAQLDGYRLAGAPLLLRSDAARAVAVNRLFFTALRRADATRIGPGQRAVMGRGLEALLRAMPPRRLAAFLIESQIIITYWHVESELCLGEELEDGDRYRARFSGRHIYFTNERNENPLRFAVTIDRKTGECAIEGE